MAQVEYLKVWCQKVLPLVYDDSLSYYEVLCKVVAKLNELIGGYGSVEELINALRVELKTYTDSQVSSSATQTKAELRRELQTLENTLTAEIGKVQGNVDAISVQIPGIKGDISGLLADVKTLQAWVDQFEWEKLYDMVADILADYIPSQVSVGLSMDGHVVIMYWKPWQDLVFNTTGLDIDLEIQPEYGHLVVSY